MSPRPYELEIFRDDNPLYVVAHATARRISGEPGSLSISPGWEIDIARVTTVSGYEIETSAVERELIREEILKIESAQ